MSSFATTARRDWTRCPIPSCIYADYVAYAQGRIPLSEYLAAIVRQESTFPADYVKLRNTENHDRPRTAELFPDPVVRENWLAWNFFQKGIALLYCGQEWAADHTPTLFDPDPVCREGQPMHEALLKALIAMKKDPLFADGVYSIEARPNDVIVGTWTLQNRKAVGVFSMKGKPVRTEVPLADGTYRNLLSGERCAVTSGILSASGRPIVLISE